MTQSEDNITLSFIILKLYGVTYQLENLILVITFIWSLCMVFGLAELCVTIKSNLDSRKQSKLNGFNYKL